MKKLVSPKKLTLSRETVRQLAQDQLAWVAGGATARCTLTLCGDSGCANTCFC